MSERPEDRWFVDWRQRGDAEALARVYDRAAPTLLRIALHHVRHPAAAEDLVQATFVAAIEGAAGYDVSRPLMGWLVAILHNQTKWLRRREGRVVDARRLAERESEDPLVSAQANEFDGQVDAAIESLPEVYHAVLRLHLKHELAAAEIAHVLGRPAGTVRSQVVRGLELLRQALPTGLAMGAFAALLPARGLDVVREAVLAKGAAVAAANAAAGSAVAIGSKSAPSAVTAPGAVAVAANAAAWIGGTMAIEKVLVGVAAVVLCGLGVLLFALPKGGGGSAAPRTTADPAAAGTFIDDAAPVAARTSTDRAAQRVPVAPPAASWRLVGRVHESTGGAPANAHVRVEATFDGGQDRLPIGEAVARGDGTFEFALDALRELPPIDLDRVSVAVTVDAEARFPQSAELPLPHRDVRAALVLEHDVELPAAATVWTGRVVDTAGMPVEGASVTFLPSATGKQPRALTDRDGRYWLAPTPDGVIEIEAEHVGAGVAAMRCTPAMAAAGPLPDLVLRSRTVLRGRLVFASGLPVPGLRVTVHETSADGSVAAHAGTTDALGAFAVHTLPPGSYRVGVAAFDDPEWPALATDAPETTLVVAEHQLLRLSFADESGRALRPMTSHLRVGDAEHIEAIAAFAAGGTLPQELEDAPSAAGGLDAMLVPRGSWCWVTASHRDHFGEALAPATEPDDVLDLTVRLLPRQPSAVLALVLTAADGQPTCEHDVRLEQLYLSEPVVWEAIPGDGPARWRCAPGRFRLEVQAKWYGEQFGWFEPFTRVITLREGEETRIEERVAVGGRVRLHVHLPGAEAGGAIAGMEVTTPAADAQPAAARRKFVQRLGGGLVRMGRASADTPLLWWPLLPPGAHALTIRSRDFADEIVHVQIRPREITDVHVHLRPR